jgi:hypothetical protein
MTSLSPRHVVLLLGACAGSVSALSACEDEKAAPSVVGTTSSSSSGAASSSSGASTSSSSSGGTSSSSSSSGGSSSSSSSSGTSDGGFSCAQPSLNDQKLLGELSAKDKGAICDYVACGFGGYGKSIACGGNISVQAKASQAECLSDTVFATCANLASGAFLACQKQLAAKPCQSLSVLETDPACAGLKACL